MHLMIVFIGSLKNKIMYSLLWIMIFLSLVKQFTNDFHSWLRRLWKSLAKFLTCDQKNLFFTVSHALLFIFQQMSVSICRDHFVYAPCQWGKTLHCNIVFHWLSAYTKWSLQMLIKISSAWWAPWKIAYNCLKKNSLKITYLWMALVSMGVI